MRSASDYYGMGGYGERGATSAGYAAAAGYGGAYRYPGWVRKNNMWFQSFKFPLSLSLRHTGYDMNAYANMYSQGAGMGSYSQTASSYGPNRGYGGGGGGGAADAGRGDKDGRGGAGATKYHPYRRY
jgi:hypothetical protein